MRREELEAELQRGLILKMGNRIALPKGEDLLKLVARWGRVTIIQDENKARANEELLRQHGYSTVLRQSGDLYILRTRRVG